MEIETEKVIEEVRVRPCIWNITHELYRNREVKKQAWSEVVHALVGNVDALSWRQKKKTDKVVHQRWKTARDKYVRCRNARINDPFNETPSSKKNYLYFERLKFLDSVLEPNAAQTPELDCKEESDEDSRSEAGNSESDYNTLNNKDGGFELRYPTVVIRDNRQILESQNIINLTSSNGAESLSDKENEKENDKVNGKENDKVKEVEKPKERNEKTVEETIQSDDLAFFSSFIPVLKKFDEMDKLQFRSEILKNAIEIKGKAQTTRFNIPLIQDYYTSKVPEEPEIPILEEIKAEKSDYDEEPLETVDWFEENDDFRDIVSAPQNNPLRTEPRRSTSTKKRKTTGVSSDEDENEFEIFGRSIVNQLKKMPLREALELQLLLQKTITEYRLQKCCEGTNSKHKDSS